MLGFMCPNVARGRIEKRSLDMKPGNHLARQLVLLPQANYVRYFGNEALQVVRNKGDEDAIHSVVKQCLASMMELLGVEG
jgi:hypothetical protein